MDDRHFIENVFNRFHFGVRHFRFSTKTFKQSMLLTSLNYFFEHFIQSVEQICTGVKCTKNTLFNHFRLCFSGPETNFSQRDHKSDKTLNNQFLRKDSNIWTYSNNILFDSALLNVDTESTQNDFLSFWLSYIEIINKKSFIEYIIIIFLLQWKCNIFIAYFYNNKSQVPNYF